MTRFSLKKKTQHLLINFQRDIDMLIKLLQIPSYLTKQVRFSNNFFLFDLEIQCLLDFYETTPLLRYNATIIEYFIDTCTY